MQKAANHLTAISIHPAARPPQSSTTLPPPVLIHRSAGSMLFQPAPFHPAKENMAYYALYGRPAAGSNVRVRLNDCGAAGLGMEVREITPSDANRQLALFL